MGICCFSVSYYESPLESEAEIRTFERDNLRMANQGFSMVEQLLAKEISPMENLLSPSAIDNFLGNVEAGSLSSLLLDRYFVMAGNMAQTRIECLLLILTKPKKIVTKVAGYEMRFSDKARYLYKTIQGKASREDLLTVRNEKLVEVAEILTDLATDVLIRYYESKSKNKLSDAYRKVSERKEAVVEIIIEELSEHAGSSKSPLQIIDDKFESDPYFLSSGYIRELALKC